MSKIYFMNDGYFDVRAMMTFGVSAKENDNAIGYFGTGFKYAVAIILRLGGKIEVKTGDEHYKFEARQESIRGQDFHIVYMNDREAGFTTHLGINWEPWMAFRELYCNCKDEGGEISSQKGEADTVITVESPLIYQAYTNKDHYFIQGSPLFSDGNVEIYKGEKPFLYYKGVAVMRQPAEKSEYSYNILSHIDLSEERVARHEHQLRFAVTRCVQGSLEDKAMLRTILTSTKSYEAALSYDKCWSFTSIFSETAQELLAAGTSINDKAREMMKEIKEASGDWPTFELSAVQKSMLDRSIAFLKGIGVEADRFPILTVDGLGEDVMGRAINKTVYLSRIPFDHGTKQVASTLLEEWVHNEHGCADFDRKMQSWLFDKVLSIGEEIAGEPL